MVHAQPQVAIVNQYLSPHVQVVHKTGVAHSYHVARSTLFRSSHNRHNITLMIVNRLISHRGTHLRALSVNKNSQVA